MRDAFESARDRGTNLGFMGANAAYWQVRYEDDRRTLVGYKSFADPVSDPALETVLFRDLQPPRPECGLVGVQFEGSFGRGDYRVVQGALGDPWLADTGLTGGAVLLGLVADEHDSLPEPLPPGCGQPGLTPLFHADGPPRADAVRYVAPSGARVFASGSMQFSWGLDAFQTENYGHLAADPRVQRLMRNALDDLLRPAEPKLVTASATPGRVSVTAPLVDPRVEIVVVRHEGAAPFDPAAGATVCRTAGPPCVDRVRGHRTYRYAATAVDRWGASRPVLSEPVAVPNARPGLRLGGPLAVRAGRRAVYSARASDLDGDRVTVRRLVDGRRSPVRARRLAVTFRAAGRHRVAVVARDGHGGVASASRPVRVTSARAAPARPPRRPRR